MEKKPDELQKLVESYSKTIYTLLVLKGPVNGHELLAALACAQKAADLLRAL